jgi:hypothetical protein
LVALIVSKWESFFAEDKTGTTRPGRIALLVQQQDLRNKIKTPALSAKPGAAEKLTTAQQQDTAGPAHSVSIKGENEIPPVVVGPSNNLMDRIKGLTSEEKERARLVDSCRAFDKRMVYRMYLKTDKLRKFLIYSALINPELVKLAITFRANPLTKGDLEEVIAQVGRIRTSRFTSLLVGSAAGDQKVGNNSASSSNSAAKYHQQKDQL